MFLEHVNLTVADLDRAVSFYRALFDFEIRWEGTDDNGRRMAHVGSRTYYLALFEATEPGRASTTVPGTVGAKVGLNHFGVVVDSLQAMKERLRSLGVTPHTELDYDPGRRLYFLDPDDIEVELVEYDR